jgi:hypothetical protein
MSVLFIFLWETAILLDWMQELSWLKPFSWKRACLVASALDLLCFALFDKIR